MPQFLVDNWPSWPEILILGPASIGYAYAGLRFAAWTKLEKDWPTGYSRKCFHFLIFFSAAFLHALFGLSAVLVFGAGTSIVLFYSLWRGSGYSLYEALAREKDAPYQTWYIIVPYLSTLGGGLLSNVFFGKYALLGYLVAGAGDAVGEPVGTRWGRHRYRVPSLKSVKATRSLEGSLAVFLVSAAALYVGLSLLEIPMVGWISWSFLIAVAVVSTIAEAISPHGLDNATMQIVPAFLVYCYL